MGLKTVIFAIVTFTLSIGLAAVPEIYAAAGDLDDTFGDGGIVTTDFNNNSSDAANAVAIQADGKIVVAGESEGESHNHFALARYNSNGFLDTSFGDGGKVTTYFNDNSSDAASAVAIQADGKIVVAGESDRNFALARYNSNGFLDTSFGSGGIVTTDFNDNSSDAAYAVAIQTDDKIVVAGISVNSTEFGNSIALARYNSNGFLDDNFGSGGIVTTSFKDNIDDHAYAVSIQADGKIVVAGEIEKNFALARYNSNGSLDTSFGDGGIVTTDFNDRSFDFAYAVAIQVDGKIVAAGLIISSIGFFQNFALARYNSDGFLDDNFGSGGKVTTEFKSYSIAYAVAIQADGKIVVAGESDDNFALARYEADVDVVPPVTPPTNDDGGYNVGSELWIKGVLQVSNSPKTMVWKEVGTDITKSGDKVISGYFYVDPNDFEFGSISNPEVFVKIYIRSDGWCNMAFNHVTVDDVTISSAFGYQGAPEQTGSVTLNSRLEEHQYTGVSVK